MSEQQYADEPILSLSKVKLTRNAKGDAQWELSVVEGAEETEIVRLRDLAIAQYRALEAAFPA